MPLKCNDILCVGKETLRGISRKASVVGVNIGNNSNNTNNFIIGGEKKLKNCFKKNNTELALGLGTSVIFKRNYSDNKGNNEENISVESSNNLANQSSNLPELNGESSNIIPWYLRDNSDSLDKTVENTEGNANKNLENFGNAPDKIIPNVKDLMQYISTQLNLSDLKYYEVANLPLSDNNSDKKLEVLRNENEYKIFLICTGLSHRHLDKSANLIKSYIKKHVKKSDLFYNTTLEGFLRGTSKYRRRKAARILKGKLPSRNISVWDIEEQNINENFHIAYSNSGYEWGVVDIGLGKNSKGFGNILGLEVHIFSEKRRIQLDLPFNWLESKRLMYPIDIVMADNEANKNQLQQQPVKSQDYKILDSNFQTDLNGKRYYHVSTHNNNSLLLNQFSNNLLTTNYNKKISKIRMFHASPFKNHYTDKNNRYQNKNIENSFSSPTNLFLLKNKVAEHTLINASIKQSQNKTKSSYLSYKNVPSYNHHRLFCTNVILNKFLLDLKHLKCVRNYSDFSSIDKKKIEIPSSLITNSYEIQNISNFPTPSLTTSNSQANVSFLDYPSDSNLEKNNGLYGIPKSHENYKRINNSGSVRSYSTLLNANPSNSDINSSSFIHAQNILESNDDFVGMPEDVYKNHKNKQQIDKKSHKVIQEMKRLAIEGDYRMVIRLASRLPSRSWGIQTFLKKEKENCLVDGSLLILWAHISYLEKAYIQEMEKIADAEKGNLQKSFSREIGINILFDKLKYEFYPMREFKKSLSEYKSLSKHSAFLRSFYEAFPEFHKSNRLHWRARIAFLGMAHAIAPRDIPVSSFEDVLLSMASIGIKPTLEEIETCLGFISMSPLFEVHDKELVYKVQYSSRGVYQDAIQKGVQRRVNSMISILDKICHYTDCDVLKSPKILFLFARASIYDNTPGSNTSQTFSGLFDTNVKKSTFLRRNRSLYYGLVLNGRYYELSRLGRNKSSILLPALSLSHFENVSELIHKLNVPLPEVFLCTRIMTYAYSDRWNLIWSYLANLNMVGVEISEKLWSLSLILTAKYADEVVISSTLITVPHLMKTFSPKLKLTKEMRTAINKMLRIVDPNNSDETYYYARRLLRGKSVSKDLENKNSSQIPTLDLSNLVF